MGCAEGPGGPWSGPWGRGALHRYWLGPGNTNVAVRPWVLGSTRYTTSRYPTQLPHPWYTTLPPHPLPVYWHCLDMRIDLDQGDPRGRIRTGEHGVGQGTLKAVSALPPPYALSSPAPPCAPTQEYLRYISVYLSISQYILWISVFSGSQYSLDLSILWISVISQLYLSY